MKMWQFVATKTPVEVEVRGRELHNFELVSLYLGAFLALGVFSLVGIVAQGIAGPAVVISVIFAAFVTVLAALFYAEFGSQYSFLNTPASYAVTLAGSGHFVAFLLAWHLALDYAIGVAIACRGIRAALDYLCGGVIAETFLEIAPIDSTNMSPYIDFVSLVLPFVASALLIIMGRELAATNVAAVLVTLFATVFIVISGAIEGDSQNWHLSGDAEGSGEGGFVPFGFLGILQGAAILAYVFMSVERIISPGRKAKDKNISGGIVSVVLISFVALLCVGIILTLMEPFYELDENTALLAAFADLTWPAAMWIVSLTAIYALIWAAIGGISAAARMLSAVENEGLLWSLKLRDSLGNFPVMLAVSIVAGVLGAFFQERHLAIILSTGSILSLIIVPLSLLLHRCRGDDTWEVTNFKAVMGQLFKRKAKSITTATSTAAAAVAAFLFCVLITSANAAFVHGSSETWSLIFAIVLAVLAGIALILLALQPSKAPAGFSVPVATLVAGVTVFLASSLLVAPSSSPAWIRLASWTVVGTLLFLLRRSKIRTSSESLAKALQENGKSSPPIFSKDSSVYSLHVEECSGSSNPGSSLADGETEVTVTQEFETPSIAAVVIAQELIEQEKIENEIVTRSEVISKAIKTTEIKEQVQQEDWEVSEDRVSETSFEETVVEVHSSKTVNRMSDTFSDINDQIEITSSENSSIESRTLEISDVVEKETSDEDIKPKAPPVPAPRKLVPSRPTSLEFQQQRNSVHIPIAPPLPPPSPPESPELSARVTHNKETFEPYLLAPPAPPLPSPTPPSSPDIRKTHQTKPSTTNEDSSSDDEHYSPPPPPVLPTPALENNELNIKAHTLHKRAPSPVKEQMSNLQNELKETLRLRNQKLIDQIENSPLKVSEGIEIFGGRKSKSESIKSSVIDVDEITTLKPVLRSQVGDEFLSKLNVILKKQVVPPSMCKETKAYSKPPKVVFVGPNDETSEEEDPEHELEMKMQHIRGTLTRMLESRRNSSMQSGVSELSTINLPKVKRLAPPPPPPAVHKTLDAMGADLQIVSLQ